MLRLPLAALGLLMAWWSWAAGPPPTVPEHTHLQLEEFAMHIHPASDGSGHRASNPFTGLSTLVHEHGLTVSGPLGSPVWSMNIQFLGLRRANTAMHHWRPHAACANGAELVWKGRGVDLQYLHDRDGLRQNFIVQEALPGDGPLELMLRTDGDLAVAIADGSGLRFTDPFGMERFSFEGLLVWDACGRILTATMELGDACTGAARIVVVDAGATYPITVDPVATTPSRQILGTSSNSFFGFAVNNVGDLNGDGYTDIAVGAPAMSMGDDQEGVVFVYYGSANGIGSVPDVILQADVPQANFGNAVAHAGDVNGDGYSDLVVGAPNWQNNSSQTFEGGMFIYHGSPTGISTIPNIILQPNSANKYMGFDVAGLGDINGDGYSDIIGGGWLAAYGQANEGAAWVYLGGPGGFTNTPAHRLERNQSAAQFGFSVGAPGDINGDGYDDVIVCAYRFDVFQVDDGAMFVYHGGPGAQPLGPGTTAQPLNPAPAQTINTAGISRRFAWCVKGAGDVNGDGYADVITGDWRDDINGPTREGTAFIFHGSPGGLVATPATILEGGLLEGWYGRSVSSAGDVNGDGYADVLIGQIKYSDALSERGAVYLHLGSPTGISPSFFIRYVGTGNGAQLGNAVGVAGDVNGDGFSEMSTGQSSAATNTGGILLFHGGPYAVTVPNPMNAPPHQVVQWGSTDALAGWSVAHAGDVNGDGYADVLVGAPDASNGQSGEGLVFVHYGKDGGMDPVPDVVLEMNQVGAGFGTAVRTAGDLNGDGYADVVIGAPGAFSGAGRAYVFMGGPAGLSTMPALTLNIGPGAQFGAAVSTAGDVDHDGFSDVIISGPGAGQVRLYRGSAAGLIATPALVINDPQPGSGFGSALATAGDVNGDGFSDIIIGAPEYVSGGVRGAAYIHHGSLTGPSATPDRTLIGNQNNCRFGTSVAGAGDVNGNGFSDVAIGADRWASGQADEGAVFVHYGSAAGVQATGFTTLQSNVVGARMGYCVAEGGDINGDGYADIVAGTPFFDGALSGQGRVYVFPGRPGGPALAGELQNAQVTGARMGWSVAGGGDTDGDGFSDVLAGAPYRQGAGNEGALWVMRGNRNTSTLRLTRQYQADLVSPLATNSFDFSDPDHFGIGHIARSHMGRRDGRLVWEVVHEGQPFSGSPINTSVAMPNVQAAYTDLGFAGMELKQLVLKAAGMRRYKWRCRVEYPIHRLPDGQRFSRWYYGFASAHGDIGVLPVELVELRASVDGPRNRIDWATASASGIDRFVVERSSDARSFSELGEVAALGHALGLEQYVLFDNAPPNGTAYYRLRMEDVHGGSTWSQVVSVTRQGSPSVIHPNPVVDRLYWKGEAPENGRVQVRDMQGRLVMETLALTLEASGLYVAQLAEGSYSLLITDAEGRVVARDRFMKVQAPMVR